MKNQKNDCCEQSKCCEQDSQAKNKKSYSRPQLSKHGKVESVTQQVPIGPSGPIKPE